MFANEKQTFHHHVITNLVYQVLESAFFLSHHSALFIKTEGYKDKLDQYSVWVA